MNFDEHVASLLRAAVAKPDITTKEGLNNTLRLLAKWRTQLVSNTIAARDGVVVQSGPFAGMRFTGQTSEGGSAPRLLGCYEAELHPTID